MEAPPNSRAPLLPACAGIYDVDIVIEGIPVKKYPHPDGTKFFILGSSGMRYAIRRSNLSHHVVATYYDIDGQVVGNGDILDPGTEFTLQALVSGSEELDMSFAVPKRTLTSNPEAFSFQGQAAIKVTFYRIMRVGAAYHSDSSYRDSKKGLSQVETRLPSEKKHLVSVTTTFNSKGTFRGSLCSVDRFEQLAVVEICYRSYSVLSEMGFPGMALVGVAWPECVRTRLLPSLLPQREVFPQVVAPRITSADGLQSLFASHLDLPLSGPAASFQPAELNGILRVHGVQVDPSRSAGLSLHAALAAMIFGDSMHSTLVDAVITAQRKRFQAHYSALDVVRPRLNVDLMAFTDALHVGVMLYAPPTHPAPILARSEIALELRTAFGLGCLKGEFVPLVPLDAVPPPPVAASPKEPKPEILPPTRLRASASSSTQPVKKFKVIDLSQDD